MKKQHLISISISLGSYADFLQQILHLATQRISGYICVANVHMLVEASRNSKFASAVNNALITTPDGLPLTWALRLLHHTRQCRVAGMDILPDLLAGASANRLSVLFYGGTDAVLAATRQYITAHCPDITAVHCISPPFRQLTDAETGEIINTINTINPHIIFISLGCPKQEKFMAETHTRIHAPMIGIGAALPVMTGQQKRAPKWMQNSGLEWLHRLAQEPRRLFKRYLITNSIFITLVLKEKLTKKQSDR